MSEEHFLPAGLGEYENCPTLNDRVCKDCNSRIGNELETAFLRVGPYGLMRWIVGLRGRKGDSPSPFMRGASRTKAIIALGRVNEYGYEVALETLPGTTECRLMPQIVVKHPILGYRPFPVFDGMTKEIFLAQLEEEGFSDAEPIAAFADPEEQDRVKEIASVFATRMEAEWTKPSYAVQEVEVSATMTVSRRLFAREIAKIGFHYVLTFWQSLRGDESEFEPIKDYIWRGNGDRFVEELTYQVFGNFDRGERPTVWSHLLHATRENGMIYAFVQLFVGPHSMPMPHKVCIGRDPRQLTLPPEKIGHQFAVTNPGAPNNKVGEMVNADVLQKIIPVFRTGRLIR